MVHFAHYAAQEFHFPQDCLLELVGAVNDFYTTKTSRWRSPDVLRTDTELFEGFLLFINRETYEGRKFHKYISDEKIEIWKKSDRKTTTKLVDDLFAFFNEAFPQTPAQLKNKNIEIGSKIAEMTIENILYIYISNIEPIHRSFYRNKAVQDALVATLATLRYEKANHGFPENLEVLVSGGYLVRWNAQSKK